MFDVYFNNIWFHSPGWEYSADGKCEKMPSTKFVNVKIKSLECFEKEGMIWIWPGDEPSEPTVPSLLPPQGFQIHAEVFYILLKVEKPIGRLFLFY